jgi:hypothetical protein
MSTNFWPGKRIERLGMMSFSLLMVVMVGGCVHEIECQFLADLAKLLLSFPGSTYCAFEVLNG